MHRPWYILLPTLTRVFYTYKKQMQADFKRVANDEQTVHLAEWGMDDYSDIVTS